MGSLRFRRSVRIAPGVRFNLSKTGAGLSAGPRGARISVHSRGVMTRSVGIPGTGLHWRDDRRLGAATREGASGRTAARTAAQPGTATAGPLTVTPVLASQALAEARARPGDPVAVRAVLGAAADGDLPALLALSDRADVGPAAAAAATLLAVERDHVAVAAALARRDLQAELDHPLTVRLLHATPVWHRVAVDRPVVVPAPLAVLLGALSACVRHGDADHVLAITAAVDPTDVPSAALTVERARAAVAAGLPDAARELLAPLARRTSLGPRVRAAGYETRVVAHLAAGDLRRARQDVERLIALDGRWPTLPTLHALTAG